MSEQQAPAVHESLDNSAAHAAVDAEAAQVAEQQQQEVQQKEAAVEEAKKSQETDRFAQKFAALSRKEKAMRAREAQIAAREKEIEDLRSKLEDDVKSKYIDPASLKKNPLKTLSDTGLSPEELAELILNDGKKTPESLVEQVKAEMRQEIEQLKNQLKEKETKEQEQKLEQVTENFKKELKSFAETTEDYELIRANDAYDLVYETIEAYYEETKDDNGENGTILSNKEACDLVEEHLLAEAKKVWEKANKKLSGIVVPKEEPSNESPTQQRQSPTLSNAMSASASKNAGRKLSDEESKAEIAKLIRWKD